MSNIAHQFISKEPAVSFSGESCGTAVSGSLVARGDTQLKSPPTASLEMNSLASGKMNGDFRRGD